MTSMLLSALILALAIGLLLGLLGGGGSILTVPALVYLFGYAAKPAIAMSLPVVGVASLVGTGLHWRLGNVQVRTAAVFGLFTMMGGFAGARLAQLVSGRVQLMLLGVVMLVSAFSLLSRKPQPETSGATRAPSARFALLIPLALAVGVLTALVGIGGGFLIVPALVLLGRVSMRQAVGTSLLVISMNAAAGFAGYLGSVSIDWPFLAGFTAAVTVGTLAGTVLMRFVPQVVLTRAFAVLLLVVAGLVLYLN